ncbi:CHAD domain-containing protein [Pseudoalteromonas sp. APC 3224]|uniref:CHAD domain-containing protein n=1 Tax=Pseudoalteromonas sp. APC 3224 TaxID=3035203 RepID=UPI0025B5D02F|nr:CHAD domain-containing protein [Pseudoalteromonas sp. APC 3224]MDN3486070.1 CHAD domain-containing protein [Pseudoalteromonas sp. APC 3224]
MSNIKAWKLLSLFCLFTALIGCQSKEEQLQQTIQESIKKADVELTQLGKALDNGSIRNAIILKEYSRILKQQQPELSKVVDVVSLDATRQGALYSGLTQRLDDIKGNYLIPPCEDTLYNIDLLREAAKPTLFSDALTDPINMLADMSNGSLARVGAISQKAEGQGVGNQMVGNPNYGNWQTNSSGISFWQWYGMYRILGDVFDRVEYGSWSKRRKYSYYNDYGRTRYSSPKQIKTQSALETRTRQSYQRQGKQFTSPYASKKTGASGLSRSSYTPPKSRSSYSRASSYSNNSGSVRNSSSRTSRGVSRGK